MPDHRDLSDLQLAILGVLWERGEATIGDVHESLRLRLGVTRKTVATLMSRLEKRAMVRQRFQGNEGVFSATMTRRSVLVSRMMAVLGALFEAHDQKAAPQFVDRGQVRAGDVARLRALLRRADRDLRGKS